MCPAMPSKLTQQSKGDKDQLVISYANDSRTRLPQLICTFQPAKRERVSKSRLCGVESRCGTEKTCIWASGPTSPRFCFPVPLSTSRFFFSFRDLREPSRLFFPCMHRLRIWRLVFPGLRYDRGSDRTNSNEVIVILCDGHVKYIPTQMLIVDLFRLRLEDILSVTRRKSAYSSAATGVMQDRQERPADHILALFGKIN